MDADQAKRVRIAVIVVVAIGLLFIGVIAFIQYSLSKNPYGEGVPISGYDGIIKNLSADKKNNIMSALYNTIVLNLPEGQTPPNIEDATIREGSDDQTEVVKNIRYEGSFIVDIESIKQSYGVNYAYSTDPNDVFVAGYPTAVRCLPIEDLKYGDFKCKDLLQQESENIDPIISILPQSTLTYQIDPVQESKGKVSLSIQLLLTEADRSSDRTQSRAIKAYKKEALDWIVSKGFSPKDYTINYSY